MALLSRHLACSVRFTNPISSIVKTHFFSSSVDQFWIQLEKNGSNIERSLSKIKVPLDTSCVTQVMQKCGADRPVLGLRFFIWAALQPSYRHSSFMYNKACNLFKIGRNPSVISDVIEVLSSDGCFVSVKTFKVVLNLCKEAKLANEGLWVLRKMKEFNCQPDTLAYNVVIRLFCEKGDMDVAGSLMTEMSVDGLYPDMITYMALVKGYADAGRLEDACGLFQVMQSHGCSPNTVMYSALLDGVCRFGSSEKALQLLGEMEKKGGDYKPNVITYTSVIQSLCGKGKSTEAMSILDQMVAYGSAPNRVTVSTLINGFCVEGREIEAYKIIDKVVGGGFVSGSECFSCLVVALLRIRKFSDAEKLFRRMLATSVHPDGLASSLVLKKLCTDGRVLDGYHLYVEIEKLGCLLSIDSDIYSILLLGLCKDGHVLEAANLFGIMAERGITLKPLYVETIIDCLKNSGEIELASHITKLQNGQ